MQNQDPSLPSNHLVAQSPPFDTTAVSQLVPGDPSDSIPDQPKLTSSKKSPVTIILIVVILLSLIGIGFLYIQQQQTQQSVKNSKTESQTAKTSSPKFEIVQEEANNDFQSYTPEVLLSGDGIEDSLAVANASDSAWLAYRPTNLSISPDLESHTVTISWIDIENQPKPYSWSIGYSTENFVPSEKLQHTRLPEAQQIDWLEITEESPFYVSLGKSVTIDVPETTDKIYFAMYVRIQNQQGQYIDFIYSSDQANQQPYMVELK